MLKHHAVEKILAEGAVAVALLQIKAVLNLLQ
jgi:hypothetical protein